MWSLSCSATISPGILFVLLGICRFVGFCQALRPVELQENSYAKVPLTSFANRWNENSSIAELQLIFRPYTNNGTLIRLSNIDRHISIHLQKGFMHLQLIEKGQTTDDFRLNEKPFTLSQIHVVNFEFFYSTQNLSVSIDDVTTRSYYSEALKENFQLNLASILLLGSSNFSPRLPTLSCCFYQVVVNNHHVILPGGATESRNLGQCQQSTAISCGENYCGQGGICYKTIRCDERLIGEEMGRSSVSSRNHESNHSDDVTTETEEQWIEYNFGNLVYVHGIESVGCDETSNQTRAPGNEFRLSIQFGDDKGLRNYKGDINKNLVDTASGPTLVFAVQALSFHRAFYFSWPIAATRVKVQLTGKKGETFCHQSWAFRGCQPENSDIWSHLKPAEWEIVLETDLTSLNDTMMSYGDVSHSPNSPSEIKIKSKWLDLISPENPLSWKVEFAERNAKHPSAMWLATDPEACTVAMTKHSLLSEVWTLRSRGFGRLCSWRQEQEAANVDQRVENTIVRISVRRSVNAIDSFVRLDGFAVKYRNISVLSGNTSEKCATSCLRESQIGCLGFQVLTKANGSRVCRKFTEKLISSVLIQTENSYVFVLQENDKTFLPTREIPDRSSQQMSGFDAGFQCQCVNGMMGARCDNNSHYDYTYHVTISDQQQETDLECPSSDTRQFIIDIEFAIGEVSTLVKNVDVAKLLKALCNGRQACPISVNSINSLLPTGGRRIKLLEVRYACALHSTAEGTPTSTNTSASHLQHPTSNATTSRQIIEGSAACHDCDVTDDVAVFEHNNEALPESGVFLLQLFEKPEPSLEVTSSTPITYLTTGHNSSVEATTLTTTEGFTSIDTTTNVESTSDETKQTTLYTEAGATAVHKPSCEDRLAADDSEVNININASCPKASKVVRRSFCDQDSKLIVKTECVSSKILEISSVLEQVTQGIIADPYVLQDVAEKQTSLLTSRADDVLPGDIIENTRILEKIVYLQSETLTDQKTLSESGKNVSESILKTVDTLFDDGLQETWNKISEDEKSLVADQLTQAMDSVGFLLARDMNESKTERRYNKNTALQVVTLHPNSQQTGKDRISFPQPDNADTSSDKEKWIEKAGNIVVPIGNVSKQPLNLVFAVYNNLDSLLGASYGEAANNNTTVVNVPQGKEKADGTTKVREKLVVNSCVISASIRPFPKDLIAKKKVIIVLRHKMSSSAPTKCVFWKAKRLNTGGHWSSDGCRVVESNHTHTKCECDHLTNFAILMNVAGIAMDTANDFVLTVMTWAGCSMSIVCLIASLFCFNALRGLRSIRNSIHKNLCVTLALAQTTFLVGVDQTDTPILCTSIAAILHYLFLSVFCWMSVEGLHLYVSLVQVFEIDKRSRLAAYYVYGYGLPALVVGISMPLRYDGYGNSRSCWLNADDDYLIWSFTGPALAVICVNTCFFIVALKVMHAHRITTPAHQTKLAKAKIWIKGSSVLLCLLGLTWIFGLFYVDERTVVMAYIFTVCNSVQGVFIFVFHCLMNDRVKAELSKYFRRSNCCPSCVRRRYHVTSSVNARSAYVTTTSLGTRGRQTSSGMAENSGRSVKSSSWIKVKTTKPKLRKVVERRDTPHWKNNALDVQDQQNTSKSNEVVDEVPYFGMIASNPYVETVKELDDDGEKKVDTEQMKLDEEGGKKDKASNVSDVDFSDELSSGCASSNNPSPIHSQKQLPVDRHDALSRHHSFPIQNKVLENIRRQEQTVDDSLLFFNIDLSLHFQTEKL